MGSPNTTGWGGPLVKARPCKVKGLDPVVKRYRVRRDGGPGGSNATGASQHRALIHAGWCGGMSEEAARVFGVCHHPSDGGTALRAGGHTAEPQDGRLRMPEHFHICIGTRAMFW